MQTLTIEAKSLESAARFVAALKEFGPELVETESGGCHVTVDLRRGNVDIVALLNAIRQEVIDRDEGAAVVSLDQAKHTLAGL